MIAHQLIQRSKNLVAGLPIFDRTPRHSGIQQTVPRLGIHLLSERDADFLKETMLILEQGSYSAFDVCHYQTIVDRRDTVEVTLYCQDGTCAYRMHRMFDEDVECFLACAEGYFQERGCSIFRHHQPEGLRVGCPEDCRPTIPNIEIEVDNDLEHNFDDISRTA